MGFYETESCQTKTDPRSENRVGGSRRFASTRTRFQPTQTPETTSETSVTITITVSGLPFWPSRDPMGEHGGDNLYAYVRNDPVDLFDVTGLYPGSEGHGEMISPRTSAMHVWNIQNIADAAFDEYIDDTWAPLRRWKSKRRNIWRLAHYYAFIGWEEDNRFVYTCKYGWLDHGHFFMNASGTYIGSQIMPSWGAAAWTEVAAFINEEVQLSGIGDETSAYTPEDLISNALGRNFGRRMVARDRNVLSPSAPLRRFREGDFFNIAKEWNKLLKSAGAVKWNSYTEPIIKADPAHFQSVGGQYMSIEAAQEYYRNSPAWKCLCNGNTPRRSQDAYQ